MSIAIKIGDEDSQVKGFIYFDAVTTFSKEISGKLTSHPVDAGVNISDHYISENPKYIVKGVISDFDITGISNLVELVDEKPINAKQKPGQAEILGQENTLQYLPSAARQFFEMSEAEVIPGTSTPSTAPTVDAILRQVMYGVYYNQADQRWRNKATTVILYEMDGVNFSNAHPDLIITNYDVQEDPDNGDALYISLTLEQARFVTLQKVEIPAKVAQKNKGKVSATSNKGKPTVESGDQGSFSANAPKKVPAWQARTQDSAAQLAGQ